MDQDEIIAMAREAGLADLTTVKEYVGLLERFAALVAAKERDACAQVCESVGNHFYPIACAAAIRARGAA